MPACKFITECVYFLFIRQDITSCEQLREHTLTTHAAACPDGLAFNTKSLSQPCDNFDHCQSRCCVNRSSATSAYASSTCGEHWSQSEMSFGASCGQEAARHGGAAQRSQSLESTFQSSDSTSSSARAAILASRQWQKRKGVPAQTECLSFQCASMCCEEVKVRGSWP